MVTCKKDKKIGQVGHGYGNVLVCCHAHLHDHNEWVNIKNPHIIARQKSREKIAQTRVYFVW